MQWSLNRQIMESVIPQFPESLIIYIKIIILDVTTLDIEEHQSNIKIDYLNISKLRIRSVSQAIVNINTIHISVHRLRNSSYLLYFYLIISLISYCLASLICYLLCIFNVVDYE